MKHRIILLVFAVLLPVFASGCALNPATGNRDFTPFMGIAREAAVGAEEHPKLLAAFGGVYTERASLTAYVDGIGRRLLAVTETPDAKFTFTIVNSDVVNAFALPGGYVYISRGLMALTNNEAELAGVIAHEIGHITARHTAQRYNRAVFAEISAAVLGAVVGNQVVSQVANLGAAAYIQGYSRICTPRAMNSPDPRQGGDQGYSRICTPRAMYEYGEGVPQDQGYSRICTPRAMACTPGGRRLYPGLLPRERVRGQSARHPLSRPGRLRSRCHGRFPGCSDVGRGNPRRRENDGRDASG